MHPCRRPVSPSGNSLDLYRKRHTHRFRPARLVALSIGPFEGIPAAAKRYGIRIIGACGSMSCKHAVGSRLDVLFVPTWSVTVVEVSTREASPAEGRFVQTVISECHRPYRCVIGSFGFRAAYSEVGVSSREASTATKKTARGKRFISSTISGGQAGRLR